MNKRYFFIILVIIELISALFILTGCGNKSGETDKESGFNNELIENYYNSLAIESRKHNSMLTDMQNNVYYEESDEYADAKNAKVSFIQLDKEMDPIMVVDYEENGNNCVTIYGKNDTSRNSYTSRNYDIQLRYNAEEQKYVWYLHYTNEFNTESFVPIKNLLDHDTENPVKEKIYDFTEKDKSELEEKLIELDGLEYKKVDIGEIHNIDENELKKYVKQAENEYKNLDELVTEKIKMAIENKVKEIEKKKEEIRLAEEAQKQEAEKKAQEEAEAKAKQAASGLAIGNKTIKYGKYVGKYGATGETLIINSDGTAVLNGETYKYKIGKYDFAQDTSTSYREAIILESYCGFYVGDDGNLWNDPMCFSYSGN